MFVITILKDKISQQRKNVLSSEEPIEQREFQKTDAECLERQWTGFFRKISKRVLQSV